MTELAVCTVFTSALRPELTYFLLVLVLIASTAIAAAATAIATAIAAATTTTTACSHTSRFHVLYSRFP